MLLKSGKLIVGVLLLPFCHAATRTFLFLLWSVKPGSPAVISMPVWGFLFGFGLWIFLFIIMPHPVRTYVFGHEMTHAFWGLVMGARISGMKVGDSGGSVHLTKSNFLIALAPYYFPFYSIIVLLVYLILLAFTDLGTYKPFWMGLLGLTWAFHLTFTWRMLREHQSDVTSQGRVFSYATIYLVNMLEICLLVVAFASPDLRLFLVKLTNEILNAVDFIFEMARRAIGFLKGLLQ